jgi:hypothetical protein
MSVSLDPLQPNALAGSFPTGRGVFSPAVFARENSQNIRSLGLKRDEFFAKIKY